MKSFTCEWFMTCFIHTGWRKPIGCLMIIGHFPQKSPITNGSFVKYDLQLEASYGSSPPFIIHVGLFIICNIYIYIYLLQIIYMCMYIYIYTYICTCIYIYIHISYMYIYMYIIYKYVYMYHRYIHIYVATTHTMPQVAGHFSQKSH